MLLIGFYYKESDGQFLNGENVDFDQPNKRTNTSPGQKKPTQLHIPTNLWEINSNFLWGISSNSLGAYTERPG